jgi:hypothetical protein
MKGARVGQPPCNPETMSCNAENSEAVELTKYSGTAGVGVTIRNGTFNLPKCRFVFTGRWMCIKTKDLL